MRLCSLLATSVLIAAATLASARPACAISAEAAGADLSAFTAGSSIPGPLTITAATLARVHAELLPSLATAHVLHLNIRFPAHILPSGSSLKAAVLPDAPSFSKLIDAIPVGERMRRIGRNHLNTSDSSMADDFALCYRVNRHWGFQMIPGDPTPVKLPVSSVHGADGVTVGMVMRLP